MQGIEQDFLDLHTLTSYVSYARKNIHPKLSDEAAEELTRGYVELRRRGNFPGSSKKVPAFKHIPTEGNLIVLSNFVHCFIYGEREGKREVFFLTFSFSLFN